MLTQQRSEPRQHLVDDGADGERPHLDGQEAVGAHGVEDRGHQLVEAFDLPDGGGVPAVGLGCLGGCLGEEVEVGAYHCQRRAQLVRHDRDELGPRLVEAAQAVELRLGLELEAPALDHAGEQLGDRRQAFDLDPGESRDGRPSSR